MAAKEPARPASRVLYITGDIHPTVEGFRITGGHATGLERKTRSLASITLLFPF
jgi:hypothetical protein